MTRRRSYTGPAPAPWTAAWWDSLSDADLQVLRTYYEAQGAGWQLREIEEEIETRAFLARLWDRHHNSRGGAHARAH